MKKVLCGLVLGTALVGAAVSPVFSQSYDYNRNEPYTSYGQPNYRYQSGNGVQYQYDLSNPSDQVRYQIDTQAQMRDQLSVDPRRDLDRGLGQWGGGIRR